MPILTSEEDVKKKSKDVLQKVFDSQLLTIDSLRILISDFHKKENQNSLEIFNSIEHNITELSSSLKSINQMIFNMTETSNKHNNFLESWKKITTPINAYGMNLEQLMLSKKNVSLMLHNLDIYVQIQEQIEIMKNLMNEDEYSNLVRVFKQIRYFSFLRIELLDKVKMVARSDKLNNLADHLLCVQQFEEEFFERFFNYLQIPRSIELGEKKPEFLVKIAKIIEEDPEYLDSIKSVFESYRKPDEKLIGLETSKNIEKRLSLDDKDLELLKEMNELNEQESLKQNLIDKIPKLIKENFQNRFKDKQVREEILDETIKCANDLFLIKTKVLICFPPKYNLFDIYKTNFLDLIKEKIRPFLNQEELEKTPALLIPIAHWLSEFDEILSKTGIDINETEIIADISYYMHLFYDHINNVLDSNLNAVIQKNLNDKQSLKTKKIDLQKIQSFYATDIYGSLNKVIDLLCGDFKGQLLFQIIKIVFEKISLLIKSSEEEITNLKNPEELTIACVYVNDASKCIEIFPNFKKKIKQLLPKDLYQHIKLRYIKSNPSIIIMYNNIIRKGCNKVIELMFKDLETEYFNKIFTHEWNDDILYGIFGTFQEYFNKGFSKILKTQNNLLIIVRSFIENFVNYYVEELIHSIRSLNRKLLKNQKESALANYEIKYLSLNDEDIVYKEKKNKLEEDEADKTQKNVATNPNIGVKDLDKYEQNKLETKKYKKYIFPVKKFEEEDKRYDPVKVLARITRDKDVFSEFLFQFSDETDEPFSKFFQQTLGSNYISNFENKFIVLINVIKCHSSALKDQIIQFKECYNDGKALLEALLYIREDVESVTKPDMKLFLLNCFNIK